MLKMQNSWSYSFQMFVSVLNETKISDILSHCKHTQQRVHAHYRIQSGKTLCGADLDLLLVTA